MRPVASIAVAGWLTTAGLTPVWAFSPDDITHWAGYGTNRAVLVVDWHDAHSTQALAWGYRWNGTETFGALLRAVRAADRRLALFDHPAYPGTAVFGVGYDRDGDGLGFLPDVPGYDRERGRALDEDDHYREGWFRVGYWSLWEGQENPYDGGQWGYVGFGLGNQPLTDGGWYGWAFDEDFGSAQGDLSAAPRTPASAESAHAVQVSAYEPGQGVGLDWVSGEPMNRAEAALGRPTVDGTADGFDVLGTNAVPVVPAAPAFRHFEVVTVGLGGRLDLRFDHPVSDDPHNPFGCDLIVFGNAIQTLAGGGSWTNGDPAASTIGPAVEAEPGRLFVSQDGTQWVAAPVGKDADTFAPTLGREYTPEHPATELGAWNRWWGAPSDPTFPLDPAVGPGEFAGGALAEMCRQYRTSAGGTAFDIGNLDLAADPATGRKWIRYIRIAPVGPTAPEVDAVADVAPAPPYVRWSLDHFTFAELADPAVGGEAGDVDLDGCGNLLEYLLGRHPRMAETAPAFDARLVGEGGGEQVAVAYRRAVDSEDSVLLVEYRDPPGAWSTNGVDQAHAVGEPADGLVRVEARLPVEAPARWIRLRTFRP